MEENGQVTELLDKMRSHSSKLVYSGEREKTEEELKAAEDALIKKLTYDMGGGTVGEPHVMNLDLEPAFRGIKGKSRYESNHAIRKLNATSRNQSSEGLRREI